jgi:elongation factor 3
MGRQKLKKSLRYEIKWRGLDHKFNTWLPREELLEKGFSKIVQQFDDLEASREGAGARDTTLLAVRKILEDVGLDGDIAQYNEMGGLSGGQKVKVVIAAALWNNPQICVLDEPTYVLPFRSGDGYSDYYTGISWTAMLSEDWQWPSAIGPELSSLSLTTKNS